MVLTRERKQERVVVLVAGRRWGAPLGLSEGGIFGMTSLSHHDRGFQSDEYAGMISPIAQAAYSDVGVPWTSNHGPTGAACDETEGTE